MPAPALASAPFKVPEMHALSVASVYGGKQLAKLGAAALRCVPRHFVMHFALDPTNFPRVLLVVSSHFSTSLDIWACTGTAARPRLAAANITTPNRLNMSGLLS